MLLYFLAGLGIYLFIISVVAVIVTRSDKSAARKGSRRTSEKALLTIAWLGGSVAMLITMRSIRHKTKKKKFMAGIPFIIILQIAIIIGVCWLMWRYGNIFR